MNTARHILTITGASLAALLVTWGCASLPSVLQATKENADDLEKRTFAVVDKYCETALLDDCRAAREQAALMLDLINHAQSDFDEAKAAAVQLERMTR